MWRIHKLTQIVSQRILWPGNNQKYIEIEIDLLIDLMLSVTYNILIGIKLLYFWNVNFVLMLNIFDSITMVSR